MERKSLGAVRRDGAGKGEARRLRREGKIPAVVYGHGQSMSVAVDAHEFTTKFHAVSESTIIQLELDKDSRDVLIRDFQEDTISGRIIHLDFLEVEQGRLLRTNVALHCAGTPIGVREGGLLESFVHELEVECLPQDLPEHIEVDITGIALGHALHVRDIQTRAAVRVLNPPDQVICAVGHKRAEERPVEEVAAVAEEEAAEAPAPAEEGAEE